MTRHGVFLIRTRAALYNGDQEAENSDQTENRESEIPTSWMKLVLDQRSAGVGKRANHDKSETMVCRHLADPRNHKRCQITTRTNFLIGVASEDTASGDVLDCKLHGG